MTPSPLLEHIKLSQWNQSVFTSNCPPSHLSVIMAAKLPCDNIKQRNNPWHFHEKGTALSDLSKHCCSIRDFWELPCRLWGNRVAGPGELYNISWLWNRKNNWGNRQAKVPAPCNWHLDVSSGHCQGNGSFDICGPPTQAVSCSADVDGHSLFQLSRPGSESRTTVVTAFPDVGSCSSLKDHMHVHILYFPKVALGSTFHQLQQATKQEV